MVLLYHSLALKIKCCVDQLNPPHLAEAHRNSLSVRFQRKKKPTEVGCSKRVARSAGVEPTTFGFGGQHSIHLSYERIVYFTKPDITAP